MGYTMKLVMNPGYEAVIAARPEVDAFAFKICEKIRAKAILIFDSQRHGLVKTYPEYRKSFFIKKVRSGKSPKWVVGNNDPAVVMVEYGTHPGGGSTYTLGYHPLTRALDSIVQGGS